MEKDGWGGPHSGPARGKRQLNVSGDLACFFPVQNEGKLYIAPIDRHRVKVSVCREVLIFERIENPDIHVCVGSLDTDPEANDY
jgi:hypothetical protein